MFPILFDFPIWFPIGNKPEVLISLWEVFDGWTGVCVPPKKEEIPIPEGVRDLLGVLKSLFKKAEGEKGTIDSV